MADDTSGTKEFDDAPDTERELDEAELEGVTGGAIHTSTRPNPGAGGSGGGSGGSNASNVPISPSGPKLVVPSPGGPIPIPYPTLPKK